MRRRWLFVAVLLLAAFACSNRVKKPRVFLNESQMVDLMTDAYLIEAELNVGKSDGKDIESLQVEYYDQLFEHYGIDDSLFKENLYYYTHHPDILERVMDSVTNRFAKALGQ